ncbi:probable LRR receptor-like serine/threonine-protein kinase At1g07650 isoform X2 [Carya illinoinensis]|uniref:probable LRR receptor-like serine/threonine-protein kinase At1g07650 isoform X2 n=1 Tax=Carya illinoinensis TaxID=32201 RepID=UPI001C71C562|nr:probable LRR receptor-like serine/threonine-protein kinase At1g07650 isoform X2 [Carya illinoinensis]
MTCHSYSSKTSFTFLMLILLMCIGPKNVSAQAGRLPFSEVEALQEIAAQLGMKDWNFRVNPCNHPSWKTPPSVERSLHNNTVNCNCSYPNGVCHVVMIFLKGQDLGGTLPAAVVKLPYLKQIDLNRNYLSGSIPREWASTKLEFLSISANNLSGRIDYLGKITTLQFLSIESNLFSGPIPPELGNLVDLETLILNANNLTGELPTALTYLTRLKILRISSNSFTGRMPDFFRSWKQLQALEIQASGLKGPIPSSISVLSNLTELKISDLIGEGSPFPPLQNIGGLEKLMLRSCNISGKIPPYISNMTQLKILDLSFNRLEGEIPNFGGLISLDTIYLTGNLLNGPIPEWIKGRDTGYSAPNICPDTINLFRSFSGTDKSILTGCLRDNPCSKDRYSLHINCGGNATTIGSIKYEADLEQGGAAKFVLMKDDTWGFSSTGHFWYARSNYLAENVSMLRMNDFELYKNARLSPLSLTYYARCLAKGNYTVKLHFAEIILRNNRSFYSVGRRIFDVYIQDKLVLKDFEIENEAGGVDKPVIRNFTAVVTNKNLEIRFHWAGKGTQDVPRRGTYGPLISAISIDSNFQPPDDRKRKIFLTLGTVLLVSTLVLTILAILRWKGYLGGRTSQEQDLKGLDLQTGFFTFRQIKAATNNFDVANKLGEGGFGSVYKGTLLDGTIIAVKQLSSKSQQGNREFVNEIGMISGLQHPNLVRLYGCCIERNQLLLVYEYMENNSLAHAMFGPDQGPVKLEWHIRQKICVGIARGLAFLHEESPLKIVHRDIKTTNVLLDRDLNPKISDFGLAKLDEEENTHISTRVAGTIGYMAPEYALWGYLTYKADIYSFGIVALELVAGKNNMKFRPTDEFVCLLDWALVLQQKGNLMELVDPRLGSNFSKEEAARMVKVALLCTNPSPALRPTMSAVVSMLEGQTATHELVMDPSIYGDELRFKALRDQFDQILEQSSTDVQTQSLLHNLMDATWIGSSTTSSSRS